MGKKSGLVMSLVANRLAVSPKAQAARSRLIPQQSRGARRRWLKVRFIIPKCGLKFRAPVSPPPSGEVKFADRGAGAPTCSRLRISGNHKAGDGFLPVKKPTTSRRSTTGITMRLVWKGAIQCLQARGFALIELR